MSESIDTRKIEDEYGIGFFDKQAVVIEKGEGVWVYSDSGEKYLDLTSGWAVTCLGHSHPSIVDALVEQSRKIMQNPNSSLTYSPSRAKLLELLVPVLPTNLKQVFFTNSGAEANDAALKLARKITSRRKIITTSQSFHGRTLSALAVTGDRKKGEAFDRRRWMEVRQSKGYKRYRGVNIGLLRRNYAALQQTIP